MPLQASSTVNLRRNRVVRWVNAAGKSQSAIVRAVTGATLTLWLPSEHRQVVTVAKATVHAKGAGFHHR